MSNDFSQLLQVLNVLEDQLENPKTIQYTGEVQDDAQKLDLANQEISQRWTEIHQLIDISRRLLDENQDMVQKIFEMKEGNSELSEKLNHLQEINYTTNLKYEEIRSEADDYQQQLFDFERRSSIMQQEITQLNQENNRLNQENTQINVELENQVKQSSKEELQALSKRHNRELQSNLQIFENLQIKYENKKAKCKKVLGELNSVNSQLQAGNKIIQTLEDQQAEFEQAEQDQEKRIKQLMQMNKEEYENSRTLRFEMKKKIAKIDRLLQEISVLKENSREQSGAQSPHESLAQELEIQKSNHRRSKSFGSRTASLIIENDMFTGAVEDSTPFRASLSLTPRPSTNVALISPKSASLATTPTKNIVNLQPVKSIPDWETALLEQEQQPKSPSLATTPPKNIVNLQPTKNIPDWETALIDQEYELDGERRKPLMEEYFCLLVLAVKLNSPNMDQIWTISNTDLYKLAVQKSIPFHKWHFWVDDFLVQEYTKNNHQESLNDQRSSCGWGYLC